MQTQLNQVLTMLAALTPAPPSQPSSSSDHSGPKRTSVHEPEELSEQPTKRADNKTTPQKQTTSEADEVQITLKDGWDDCLDSMIVDDNPDDSLQPQQLFDIGGSSSTGAAKPSC